MQIEMRKVSELIPYENNPRINDQAVDAVAASIKEFGFKVPVIIDKDDVVIAGHTRIKAARQLDMDEVPTIKADDLTPEQVKAFRIADNSTSSLSDWDLQKLSQEASLLDFDMERFGLSFDLSFDLIEPEEDDFDLTAALEEASFVEPGDVWTVGRHRLICGDATNLSDVETLMDKKKANLILTDPPYAVSYESASGLSIKNDNLKAEEFYDFLLNSFKNMIEVSEDGASAYVFHADTEGLTFRKAFEDAGFHLSGVCIWAKDSLVLGRSPYQWSHEPILFGWNKKGKHEWYAGRAEKTVWQFNKPKKNENHPTSKPIDLLSYPIQNSSRANGIVLDLFGGSGSTLIACEQTDRICYMAEVDDKYASVILRRYVEFKSGDSSDVFVERDGKKIPYKKLVKTVG